MKAEVHSIKVPSLHSADPLGENLNAALQIGRARIHTFKASVFLMDLNSTGHKEIVSTSALAK